ncbi:MAG: hypothetical protein JST53_08060 [Actinobacteria bacterium]|nr:hypothetical protein [Actinomycetota bacterium]
MNKGAKPASRFHVPFERTFVFDGSPGDLWDAVALLARRNDFDERMFRFELSGRPLEAGSTVDVDVTPPLPYRVRLQIQFSECIRPSEIKIAIRGDVDGVGSVRLLQRGDKTYVMATWSVEIVQPAMRTAARVAYPIVVWGQDLAVDSIVRAFRRQLAP